MSDRIACSVPGCRRTAPRQPGDDEDAEIICGKHARFAPPATRRRLRLINKRVLAMMERHPDPDTMTPEEGAAAVRLLRAASTAWRVFVKQAVQGAAGL